MKLYFTSLSLDGSIDGCVKDQIASQFENSSSQECDYVGLVITYTPSWTYNAEEFERIKDKPFVIFDYTEYGWEESDIHHFYGFNTRSYAEKFKNKE